MSRLWSLERGVSRQVAAMLYFLEISRLSGQGETGRLSVLHVWEVDFYCGREPTFIISLSSGPFLR